MKPLHHSLLRTLALIAALGLPFTTAQAQGEGGSTAKSVAELLKQVQDENRGDVRINKEREAQFKQDLAKLSATLIRAQRDRAREEAISEQLETKFRENEKQLAELQDRLQERLGTLGELFGQFRQVAGDTREVLRSSITTAEHTGRVQQMSKLAQEKELPAVEELELLWETILGEMYYTGQVAKFQASVVGTDGNAQDVAVVRVGPFNAVADGKFLKWEPETQQLSELSRQPASRHQSAAADLEAADPGDLVSMSIDPTRGTILALLVSTPSFVERLQQGGLVGYLIMAGGVLGLLLLIVRLLALASVGGRMRTQIKSSAPNLNNPLGRVMAVYEQNKDVEFETLELKLDETIIKEVPVLERGLTTLKVLSVIAPLMGLLGTVTGMIITFQQITLFGTGDPKLMAGGISTALVTTMQGLIVAIPLVLAHSFLRDRSKSLIQILEEQSAGMIAQRAEQESRGAGTAS